MKKLNILVAIFLVVLISGCSQNDVITSDEESASLLKSASVSGKYIVVLNNDADLLNYNFQTRNSRIKGKALGLLKKYEIAAAVEEIYETALQGFTVKMTPVLARKLGSDPLVKFVEVDKVISLSPVVVNGKPGPAPQPVQSIPWGISRVGGSSDGTGKTAWVIDTGIDLTHPDLNVDASRSATFLGGKSTPWDENGHGTHVAGTIAAKNNDIGVVGVAAGATVVSVRVLNRQGSGTNSGVIAGVNYVAANGIKGDVANMSLGGGVSAALDQAVLNASKNVKFALAAGNESDDANNHSPARVDGSNIYTVSAMWEGDSWASFSNFGNPPVDFCAPGVYIYSTYKNGGYETLHGTSMATPHVAGLLLLGKIQTDGYVTGDPDGEPDPIAHR